MTLTFNYDLEIRMNTFPWMTFFDRYYVVTFDSPMMKGKASKQDYGIITRFQVYRGRKFLSKLHRDSPSEMDVIDY